MPDDSHHGNLDLSNRLALSIQEAASAIGISERSLRELLPELPHTHLGRRVVIPLEPLREWLHRRTEAEKATSADIASEIVASMEASKYDNI